MELPSEIVSKIMTYHSNLRFDKKELLNYVWVNQRFYECIYCEIQGYNTALLMILDLDERIGELFFKWAVKEIAREFVWEELYQDHYYERTFVPRPLFPLGLIPDYSLDMYMDPSFDVTQYLRV